SQRKEAEEARRCAAAATSHCSSDAGGWRPPPRVLLIYLGNDPRRDLTPRGVAVAVSRLEAAAVSLVSQVSVLNPGGNGKVALEYACVTDTAPALSQNIRQHYCACGNSGRS